MKKKFPKKALGVGFVAIFAICYILAVKSSSVLTDDVFRAIAAGGTLSDRQTDRLRFAVTLGILSIIFAAVGVMLLCGRTHRRSGRAAALTLSAMPVWRGCAILLRYYIFCGSSISSRAIRERFAANSHTLEWVMLFVIVGVGAVAFFSRYAKEY